MLQNAESRSTFSYMTAVLKRVAADLRAGENLDAYVTIVVAVTLAVLNLLGVVPTSKLSGVLLAVLALIATGTLTTRARLDALARSSASPNSPPLLQRFPDSYQEDLAAGGDLYLGGVSLTSLFPGRVHDLDRRLRAGERVRVLLVKPGTPAVDLAERRMAIPPDHERRENQIKATLGHLRWLLDTAGGRLEVRFTEQPLPLGWVFVAPDTSRSTLYVQYYAFRTRLQSTMMLCLRPADGNWYDTHREQVEEYWNDGEPWGGSWHHVR